MKKLFGLVVGLLIIGYYFYNSLSSHSLSTSVHSGSYKDGTYDGSVEDAIYGNVQVEAIIAGGKITDVKFLAYPSDRDLSVEINSQAMPQLTQEAITIQDAQVDAVSGATATSQAFIKSLNSALSKAS